MATALKWSMSSDNSHISLSLLNSVPSWLEQVWLGIKNADMEIMFSFR